MLADEPVASLDPATATRVLALIHDICKSDGIPTIISLHQVDLSRQFADRVIGLADGNVVYDGPGSELNDAVLTKIYDNTADQGDETQDAGENLQPNLAST